MRMHALDFALSKRKIKSICFESEPILEELEEQLVQEVDLMYHTFIVPSSMRLQSVDEIANGNSRKISSEGSRSFQDQ